MALKSKGFFLNLEEGASTDRAIQIAPVRDLPVEDSEEESLAPISAISKTTDVSGTVETAKPAAVVNAGVTTAAPATAADPATSAPATPAPTASAPSAAAGSLTTAEAIAAALAEAEAARPVVTLSTFAPDMLQPGRALQSKSRRPGRNLKGFKDMASELFSS